MYKGMYVAVSGALAALKRLDTVANNLANMSTPGFKSDSLVFESYLNKEVAKTAPSTKEEAMNPEFMRQAEYVVPAEQYTDFSQGPMRTTGNPLDVALEGDGFLAVMTYEGERYTRGGALKVGPSGELVTNSGHMVLDDRDRPIYVNDGFVTIDESGAVWVSGGTNMADADLPEGSFGVLAGRLKLVDFEKPYRLEKQGDGLFRAGDPAGAVMPDRLKAMQGYLEDSNVNMIRSMTEMIELQRMTETYQKAIRQSDEMTQLGITRVGQSQ